MEKFNDGTLSVGMPTLAFRGARALFFQGLLIGAAVALPVVAHMSGAPVRLLLPMHWPVILAGLVYGWRGGSIAGLLAPTVNYLISGFPLPAVLPPMTIELAAYGFLSGMMREKGHFNPFLSVAVALVAGRILFLGVLAATSPLPMNISESIVTLFLPGLGAALLQIILLPFVARSWIVFEQQTPHE